MPLGIAILTFFALEGVIISQPGIQLGHLLLGLIGSGIVYFATCFIEKTANTEKDNPPNVVYELPLPQAFALMLSTIKTFRAGERRWIISEIDRNHYSITAFAEWHDKSWRKYNRYLFDEPLFRQIKLRLFMRRKGYRLVEIAMIWSVISPLTRCECNAVQSYTTQVIQDALRRAEITRATKYKTVNKAS